MGTDILVFEVRRTKARNELVLLHVRQVIGNFLVLERIEVRARSSLHPRRCFLRFLLFRCLTKFRRFFSLRTFLEISRTRNFYEYSVNL